MQRRIYLCVRLSDISYLSVLHAWFCLVVSHVACFDVEYGGISLITSRIEAGGAVPQSCDATYGCVQYALGLAVSTSACGTTGEDWRRGHHSSHRHTHCACRAVVSY